MQWFERSRVEVLVTGEIYRGRIGADYLAGRGTPWVFGDGSTPDGCQAVSETGYAICEPFLSAWRQFGGTDRLGLPISGVQEETYVDAGTGQTVTFPTLWLERGALEAQPDGVKLRLLGNQTYPTWAERLLADLINAERQKAGLNTLEWHDDLAHIARSHSEDLKQHNMVGHIGSDGSDPVSRSTGNVSLSGFFGGETIAHELSPVESIRRLMNSPSHREIILYDNTTHFGVGYAVNLGQVFEGYQPMPYWTTLFWVAQ
ncbi:MAG: CAP domain-containing protein [Blastochloris sp.]|nr:CAP domain-containing protein [Blastochloris sp.]